MRKSFEIHSGHRVECGEPVKTNDGKYVASVTIRKVGDRQRAVVFFLSHEYMRPMESEETARDYALAWGGGWVAMQMGKLLPL